MKRRFMVLVALFALALMTQIASAQPELCGTDPNIPDTVIIVCGATANVTPGDSIAVDVYVWTDDDLQSFTLGFKWANDNVEWSSAYLNSGLAGAGFVQLLNTQSTGQNIVGLGVINFGIAKIAASPNRQHVYKMYYKIQPAAVSGRVAVDSTFFPPAGTFIVVLSGSAVQVCPKFVSCEVGVPVYEYSEPVLPTEFGLSQNTPNPFNPSTSIDFALPKASEVKIEVFNTLGQHVATIYDGYLNAGYKRVEWDGTNENGNQVASGVYLYRMKAGNFTATKKMMLMK